MTTNDPKTRTITMTGRPPVKIREDEWPIIAAGDWDEHDGQIAQQANRTWSLTLRVRQHADGRAIVYGTYFYGTNFQHESSFGARAGILVAGGDLPAAITKVGETLRARMEDADDNAAKGLRHIQAAVAECIGDLPAETL